MPAQSTDSYIREFVLGLTGKGQSFSAGLQTSWRPGSVVGRPNPISAQTEPVMATTRLGTSEAIAQTKAEAVVMQTVGVERASERHRAHNY